MCEPISTTTLLVIVGLSSFFGGATIGGGITAGIFLLKNKSKRQTRSESTANLIPDQEKSLDDQISSHQKEGIDSGQGESQSVASEEESRYSEGEEVVTTQTYLRQDQLRKRKVEVLDSSEAFLKSSNFE